DYATAAGVLHFNAGDTSKVISIQVNGDTRFEPNETFNVMLSGATNGATISDNQGVGTIINDDTNQLPVVTTHDVTAAANGSVAASALFTAHDPDGDSTITQYAFWDGVSGGGHFSVGGVAQASGQWIYVAAGNLGSVSYVGGPGAGSETLYVDAEDGQAWGNYVALTATTASGDVVTGTDGNDTLFG